jgi:hypothetical protein
MCVETKDIHSMPSGSTIDKVEELEEMRNPIVCVSLFYVIDPGSIRPRARILGGPRWGLPKIDMGRGERSVERDPLFAVFL